MRQLADAPNALEAEQMDNAAQAQAVVEESRVRQRVTDAVRREEKRLVAEMTPLVGKKAAETFGRLHVEQARGFETAYGVDAAGLLQRRRVERGRIDAEGEALHQAALYEQTPPGETSAPGGNEKAQRFAALPPMEADSTQWFGEGTAVMNGRSTTQPRAGSLWRYRASSLLPDMFLKSMNTVSFAGCE